MVPMRCRRARSVSIDEVVGMTVGDDAHVDAGWKISEAEAIGAGPRAHERISHHGDVCGFEHQTGMAEIADPQRTSPRCRRV